MKPLPADDDFSQLKQAISNFAGDKVASGPLRQELVPFVQSMEQ
jgi:hypothetical protein